MKISKYLSFIGVSTCLSVGTASAEISEMPMFDVVLNCYQTEAVIVNDNGSIEPFSRSGAMKVAIVKNEMTTYFPTSSSPARYDYIRGFIDTTKGFAHLSFIPHDKMFGMYGGYETLSVFIFTDGRPTTLISLSTEIYEGRSYTRNGVYSCSH